MTAKRANRRIPEKEFNPDRFTQRVAMPVAVALLLIAGVALVLDRMAHPEAFPIDQIHYRGDFSFVAPEEIEAAVMPVVNGNLLVLDIHAVERAAASVPWVDHATVRRRWPHAIYVSVVEHQPVARWGSGGWVTARGTVVDDPQAKIDTRLPVLRGSVDTQAQMLDRYQAWGSILARVGLRVEELTRSERGAWQVRVRVTDAGVARPNKPMVDAGLAGLDPQPVLFDLVLGRNEADERIARFSRVYRHSLLSRIGWVDQVDLRHSNGFSVRWIPIEENESEQGSDSGETPKKA